MRGRTWRSRGAKDGRCVSAVMPEAGAPGHVIRRPGRRRHSYATAAWACLKALEVTVLNGNQGGMYEGSNGEAGRRDARTYPARGGGGRLLQPRRQEVQVRRAMRHHMVHAVLRHLLLPVQLRQRPLLIREKLPARTRSKGDLMSAGMVGLAGAPASAGRREHALWNCLAWVVARTRTLVFSNASRAGFADMHGCPGLAEQALGRGAGITPGPFGDDHLPVHHLGRDAALVANKVGDVLLTVSILRQAYVKDKTAPGVPGASNPPAHAVAGFL